MVHAPALVPRWSQVGRPPGGKEGPFIAFGRVLRERRETMPGLQYEDRTQRRFAERLGVSQSFLGRIERGIENLPNYDLSWFRKYAPHYGWTPEQMLGALGIQIVKGTGTTRAPDDGGHRQRLTSPEDDPPGRAMSIDLMPAGCGPALESDERIGTISIPEDMARGGKRLIALRAEGTSMTPELDHGDIAIAAIDDGLCQPGDLCPIYLPDEGVVIKRFVRELRDGTLLLESLNPAEGQEAVFEAPAGARVLGKAVFVIKSL